MTLWNDNKKLRSGFFETTEAQINATTAGPTTVHTICRYNKSAKVALFRNGFNCDVNIYLVHPDNDAAVVANRILWVKVRALTPLNIDISGTIGLEIEPKTSILISKTAGNSSNGGTFDLFIWG